MLLQVLLSLSDQQLITGLAILIVATIRMQVAQLSVYHYTICADMAWFSANAHLSTLDALAEYLWRKEKPLQRKDTLDRPLERPEKAFSRKLSWLMTIRIFFMLALAVFLSMAVVIEGDKWWGGDLEFPCPVACVRENLGTVFGGESGVAAIAYLILLWFGYLPVMIKLFSGNDIFEKLEKKCSNLDHKFRDRIGRRVVVGAVYNVCARLLQIFWYCLTSILTGIIVTLLWFSLGEYWLVSDWLAGRRIIGNQPGTDDTEQQWGFGQVVPMFFLVLPFLAIFEVFEGLLNFILPNRAWNRLTTMFRSQRSRL
jgi:hypothetical protein